ncbi:hypothetical protein [Methanobrevibacter sp.]
MKKQNSVNGTVILKKDSSDGFLDFNYPGELSEVLRILNKIMNE